MFYFFRKARIQKHINGAEAYAIAHFKNLIKGAESQVKQIIRQNERKIDQDLRSGNRRINPPSKNADVLYSVREPHSSTDHYNPSNVTEIIHSLFEDETPESVLERLGQNTDQTFTARLLYYIDKTGVRDASVYKAAQIDKRLFSKIISDKNYQPSKDTAIALAFGLKLTFEETADLIARAGYTFSHSKKRDLVIEYFFKENYYNLVEINLILDQLGQKTIGRL